MSHAPRCLAVRLALGILGLVCIASAATAQTTVTLNQAGTRVWDATVRGGTYANTNLSTILETRASTDPEYLRRAFLKFDTENTIPAGTAVSRALFSITVKQGSGDPSRRIAIYQVTTSWEEPQVTYRVRKTSTAWGTAGGDLGSRITEVAVPNVPGTRVDFDVTTLVRQAVAGSLGSSRYTRFALVDLDASSQ